MAVDLVNAIAALGTFVLLAATSVAGFIQLRHMRAGNELAAVLAVERDFRTPVIQAALVYVAHDLPARMEDPAYRRELELPGYIDPAAHPEMALCNWFNRAGALVRAGFLGEGLFLDSFGRLVEFHWALLGPAIAVLRRSRGDTQYAGFEYLAYRAQARRRARAARAARVAGLPALDPWADDDLRRS